MRSLASARPRAPNWIMPGMRAKLGWCKQESCISSKNATQTTQPFTYRFKLHFNHSVRASHKWCCIMQNFSCRYSARTVIYLSMKSFGLILNEDFNLKIINIFTKDNIYISMFSYKILLLPVNCFFYWTKSSDSKSCCSNSYISILLEIVNFRDMSTKVQLSWIMCL